MTKEYCPTADGGIDECKKPKAPNCEDRTVLCLGELPIYEEMVLKNLTGDDTLNERSLRAKFEYSCTNPGRLDLIKCTH